MKLSIDDRSTYAATGNKKFDPGLDSVVFVHGAGQDQTVWVLPIRYFARHGRNVLAPDLPGHGSSDGPPLTSIEDMADWIVRVMDAAGLEKAALVGHSMGSLVSLEAAARHPDRVRAIALVGTAVPMPVSDALLSNAEENDHAAIDMLTFWGYSRAAQMGGNATPGMWMLGGGQRLLERAAPGVIHADLKACNDYQGGPESAKKVKCRALLILGERDIMTPTRVAANLAEAIPNAERTIFKGAGHLLLAERPDPVLDELIRIV